MALSRQETFKYIELIIIQRWAKIEIPDGTDGAYKPLSQLNNPKSYKTFGIHFLSKFVSLTYACTFMSANHVIYIIGYFKQTGKKMSS